MSGLVSKLNTLKAFMASLTWMKIAQLVVLFLVMALAWITYETREDLVRYIFSQQEHNIPLKKLSAKTTEELKAAIGKNDLVVAVAVNVINFKTNSRYVIFSYSPDKDLTNVYNRYNMENLEQPLFTNNPEHNKRIIELINGEFVCHKYINTIGSVDLPDTRNYIDTVCANGVPPYYGKIIGVVSIFTKREPIPEEVDQIRVLTRNLAILIYDKELK